MVTETDRRTESEDERRITRRGLIRGGAAAAGVGLVGGVGIWHGSQPAFAAELSEENWEANDASIRTYDGTITGVTLDPTINVEWSGVGAEEKEIDLELEVSFPEEDGSLLDLITLDPDDSVSIYNETKTVDGHFGEKEIDLSPITITDKEDIDKGFFEAPDGGTTNDTPVDLTLIVAPQVDEFNELEETVTFTVSVENVSSSLLAGGESEVTVDSDSEYPEDD